MSTLFAGPWRGEFGWMVATWIPAIRYRSKKYDRTVMIIDEAFRPLVEDFAEVMHDGIKAKLPDRWLADGKRPKPTAAQLEEIVGSRLIRPDADICMSNKKLYRIYGIRSSQPCNFGLLIHARKVRKSDKWDREWPLANYIKIANEFSLHTSCTAASIGHPDGAEHVPGTIDMRGIPIDELCSLMRNSNCLLSPSSGPAHLASMCGCPHVVMTDNEYKRAIGGTNRDRYTRLWNPFQTPCKVLDKHNWQPPVDVVWEAVCRFVR